jgi:UDP-N-acetylglucosamine--N-acetylmuramyl-(pentapeptide) pyrophosphoryl-undecaprenol N-acetylglucosamine transferase
MWATWRLIRRERPAAILGTGGYVCVPVFLAARLAGVPTVIYLPDVVPGLAVRFLARVATQVACSVGDSARFLPGLAPVVTGYPIRPELAQIDRAAGRTAFGLRADLPVLLVTGGSRGARSINQAISALLPQLLAITQIIHVCGREGDQQFLEEALMAAPAELRDRYRLYPYLHSDPLSQPALSMSAALAAADLVVCRSGASTLGELPALGLPAVLIPYPYVHQDENADFLTRQGAAVKIADADMLGAGRPDQGPLMRQIQSLIVEPDERASMGTQSRSLAAPDAADRLASLLLALASRRRAA